MRVHVSERVGLAAVWTAARPRGQPSASMSIAAWYCNVGPARGQRLSTVDAEAVQKYGCWENVVGLLLQCEFLAAKEATWFTECFSYLDIVDRQFLMI